MTRLDTGFSGLSDNRLYHLGLTIPQNVGGIAASSGLKGQLPAITAVTQATLTVLGNALMIVLGVTDTALAGSGYTLRATPVHTSAPPDAPSNLRLKTTGQSGELQVMLDKVDRAVMYEVTWTLNPVAGLWTDAGTYSSTRGIKLTGLTRGKDYFVHVRAIASGQNVGAWSDLASAMVV